VRPGGFPFEAAVGFALVALGLGPRDLWALTPRELAAAAAYVTGGGEGATGRAEFEALMAKFPDRRS
jgi:uncharacterized phage protein (TIGR02216 family)